MTADGKKITWPLTVYLRCDLCERRHVVHGHTLAGCQRSAYRARWYTDPDDWDGWESSKHVIPATCRDCMVSDEEEEA